MAGARGARGRPDESGPEEPQCPAGRTVGSRSPKAGTALGTYLTREGGSVLTHPHRPLLPGEQVSIELSISAAHCATLWKRRDCASLGAPVGLGTLLVSSAQDAVPCSEGQQETRTQSR